MAINMYSIGLDIGTTSICGILINAKTGELLKSITRDNTSDIKGEKSYEKLQNPDIIYAETMKILEELYSDNVISIGISGQMHGILYLDKDGNAVSPLYIWQDGRGDLAYQNTTYAGFLEAHTGYGNVTNFYNEQNNLVPENAVVYCTIGDFIAIKLAGVNVPTVHSTNAASLGCYDFSENKFSIKNNLLPEITTDYSVVGKYKNTPVSVSIGDNQASFIGSVYDNDCVLVNVGTGSQVSYITDKPEAVSGLEVRPYVENKYLMAGCALCGGRSFAILEQFFGKIVSMAINEEPKNLYKIMDKILENPVENTLVFDNKFSGSRENPALRGSISNISIDNFTPEHFMIGIIYGIANELFDMYKNSGKTCKALIGSGNGVRRNEALKKVFSEIFGSEINIPKVNEEASFGAALFSLVAVGFYESIEKAQELNR